MEYGTWLMIWYMIDAYVLVHNGFVVWYKFYLADDQLHGDEIKTMTVKVTCGIKCQVERLQVDGNETVTVIVVITEVLIVEVKMELILVGTIGIQLYFKATGWGKEMGLYPPSGWFHRTQGVEYSFRLDPENQGVIAFF
jgi:hypothetical protein